MSGPAWADSYIEDIVLYYLKKESLGVWGIDDSDDFIPHRTAIKVCKAENTVFVGFYLSQKNIDFYRQTFSNGKRKPIGFEIDVFDQSTVFARSDLISLGYSSSTLSGISYIDNYLGDSDNRYTLAINDPTNVSPNTWMFWKFKFSKHREVSPATYDVQVQLMGNLRTLRSEYRNLYEKYGTTVQSGVYTWLSNVSASDGNDFFNLRNGQQIFWNDKFFQGGDRLVYQWGLDDSKKHFDFIPYACDFGPDPYGVSGATSVPSPDPESTTPPPPPSNLPSLVSAGTSSSAPNLSVTVVIEKHDQSEDTNQQVLF
ncbi:MAG: hypothetical protein WBC29_01075, partial [Candidatus Moraniibacteriota bacterium]